MSLSHCSLEKFVKIMAEKFGMGHDYAIKDRQGKPLQSWFTLQEALTAVRDSGFEISEDDVRFYLDRLVKNKKFESNGFTFRRCAFLPFNLNNEDDRRRVRKRYFRRGIDRRIPENDF